MILHGVPLSTAGPCRIAVIVEPAQPARITPLLMSAYGLTEREQELTLLVLHGDSTTDIAERLVISPFTVQQHLKSIFEKTGVRSRRDLVGKVFGRPTSRGSGTTRIGPHRIAHCAAARCHSVTRSVADV